MSGIHLKKVHSFRTLMRALYIFKLISYDEYLLVFVRSHNINSNNPADRFFCK